VTIRSSISRWSWSASCSPTTILFIERKLYPNVDFYSGSMFRPLGLPPAMFTPIFAVARTVGWVAQWNEMIADPRQLYTGPGERDLVPIAERTAYRPLVG